VRTLLAVPNVSEGRDERTIAALADAFASAQARLLDVHSDPDHHRSVFTLAAAPGGLADALLAGARAAAELVDVGGRGGLDPAEAGQHPHVGSIDIVPIVYLDEQMRGAACAEALVIADRIGEELQVPVFLYGELTRGDGAAPVTRAELRRGGLAGLGARMVERAAEDGEPSATAPSAGLRPDFGPPHVHPRAGATLLAARPPLVAFNLQLRAPADIAEARRIAGLIREGGGEGLPGLRAIAVQLGSGVAQVSMNVERPHELPLAAIVRAVGTHAAIASAEIVGLAPRAALAGFPADVPLRGFDAGRHVIENALGCL
jgi:glutamate formiminotransferase/glutamate formiminotransferase/formiminotetrahydrofolate cyclodeaminase